MSEFTGKSRVLKSPTGSKLNCKGWVQEAAYRMLHNNLDPEVAERPEDLIVYGGLGKAARNWPAFDDFLKQDLFQGTRTEQNWTSFGWSIRCDHLAAWRLWRKLA